MGWKPQIYPILFLPGSSNISSPLSVEENDVDFVNATNLLTKTVEENDIEGVIPVVTRVPRKLVTPNRIINSLDAALEPDNYDEVQLPLSVEGDNVNEILTGYLGPKSKAGTKNIYWTSEENTYVGRQRSCDVIRSAVSTVRYSNDIHTITDCFHKFIDEQISIINQHLDKIKNNNRYGFLHKTDSPEIRALFWFSIFSWTSWPTQSYNKYFFLQKSWASCIWATISSNRFQFLIANLMFGKSDERKEKWPYDRFTAIRDFFKCFNLDYLNIYHWMNPHIPFATSNLDETI